MSLKSLMEYTFVSKYARYLPEQKRRETWKESCDRVRNMMHEKYISASPELHDKIDWAYDMMYKKRVLGSQRALQFGGKPIFSHNSRIYNCVSSYIDRLRFFQECMYLLLCGCGTGFSVQKHHIDKLPPMLSVSSEKNKKFVIEDTIEGWSDAVGVLISSYFDQQELFPEYVGYNVIFDYTNIRPAGSPITGGIGKAPGSEPLKKALKNIKKILDAAITRNEFSSDNLRKLKPIEAYDIVMHASDAVISGGVRRCLPKGSMVHTKGGMVPIERVKVGDLVLTTDGYHKVTNNFEQGVQKLIEVVTQDSSFKCTPNHKIAVLTGLDTYKWVRADELEFGDRVISPSISIDGNRQSLPEFNYKKPNNSTTCKNITIPELDENIAWLIGLIQGDGYVYSDDNKGCVSIPYSHDETGLKIGHKALTLLEKFGVKVGKTEYENYSVLRVKSKQLGLYFNSWLKQPKTNLVVPDFIWGAKREIRLAYVCGLFDSDGSTKNRPINVLTTVYKDFAENIQILLSSCGVQSRFKELTRKGLKENWKTKYGVYLINKKSKEIFKNNLNLLKSAGLEISNSEKFSNSYPKEMLDFAHPNNYCWSNTNNKLIPVSVLEVNNIEEYDETYDIEVENKHEFFCNGYLVHNSATICVFSPDDEEMASAKTGNWFDENPQRGRSNNSALLLRSGTTKEQFAKLMESVKQFGEPGFIWSDSTELIVNPCVTIDTKILTIDGWKEIGSLLGKDIDIYQDSRVFGGINEDGEFWDIDMSQKNECVVNMASNVRKTGVNRDVYQLELSCGRTVKATDNHHFATPDGMCELKDLSTEDYLLIPIPPMANIDKESKDFNIGYLYGLIFGDGCFADNAARISLWGESDLTSIEKMVESIISPLKDSLKTCRGNTSPKFSTVSGEQYGSVEKHCLQSSLLATAFEKYGLKTNKEEISFIHNTSKGFKSGFISGLFYADGHSEYSESSKSLSLRITSIKKNILQDVQLLLQELGVFSRINIAREAGTAMLPDSNRDYKEYNTQNCYRLIIGGLENCFKAISVLKLNDKHTALVKEKYNNRKTSKTNVFTSKVESITYVGKEDVYCLSENNRRTMIVEGITSRRCVEVGFYPVDIETGLSGWQGCNLSTINCSKVKTEEDFYEACKAASIIGTLQAGFTSFPYLGETSERIFKREALLGVSGTGWLEKSEICLNPKIQKTGAKIVKAANKEMVSLININIAARTTCVKPEGSVSCVLGTSSGIHPHHAKRYIRRTQANKMEDVYKFFKKHNPRACEASVWSANDTDDVISFCVEVPDGSKLKNQITAISLLEIVKSTQQNWVLNGRNLDQCTQPWLTHNVSNTINIQNDEWEIVTDFIYENRNYFCGVSLLPATGDKDYPQAPFTTVYLPSEMLSYYGEGVMFVSGLIETALLLWEDNLWDACSALLGSGRLKGHAKKEWAQRCAKYAINYFDGDVKKLTYAIKDVYNYKLWTELQREYKEVDYTNLFEETDNTKLQEELACSNGRCEI